MSRESVARAMSRESVARAMSRESVARAMSREPVLFRDVARGYRLRIWEK